VRPLNLFEMQASRLPSQALKDTSMAWAYRGKDLYWWWWVSGVDTAMIGINNKSKDFVLIKYQLPVDQPPTLITNLPTSALCADGNEPYLTTEISVFSI